jgi:light-independent protochlorophyllide reductase subunit B
MGWEGANVIFDTWIHPLVMGLEEHLLAMFREDFEFHDAAGPSHHGGHSPKAMDGVGGHEPALAAVAGGPAPQTPRHISEAKMDDAAATAATGGDVMVWLADAEKELKKIPFFVRGKARRNTEKFAAEQGVTEISIDTLYEAKAHYAR